MEPTTTTTTTNATGAVPTDAAVTMGEGAEIFTLAQPLPSNNRIPKRLRSPVVDGDDERSTDATRMEMLVPRIERWIDETQQIHRVEDEDNWCAAYSKSRLTPSPFTYKVRKGTQTTGRWEKPEKLEFEDIGKPSPADHLRLCRIQNDEVLEEQLYKRQYRAEFEMAREMRIKCEQTRAEWAALLQAKRKGEKKDPKHGIREFIFNIKKDAEEHVDQWKNVAGAANLLIQQTEGKWRFEEKHWSPQHTPAEKRAPTHPECSQRDAASVEVLDDIHTFDERIQALASRIRGQEKGRQKRKTKNPKAKVGQPKKTMAEVMCERRRNLPLRPKMWKMSKQKRLQRRFPQHEGLRHQSRENLGGERVVALPAPRQRKETHGSATRKESNQMVHENRSFAVGTFYVSVANQHQTLSELVERKKKSRNDLRGQLAMNRSEGIDCQSLRKMMDKLDAEIPEFTKQRDMLWSILTKASSGAIEEAKGMYENFKSMLEQWTTRSTTGQSRNVGRPTSSRKQTAQLSPGVEEHFSP